MGTLSVNPSTWIGLGKGLRIVASFSSTGRAAADSVALPLGNRMLVLISTCTHDLSLRTLIRCLLMSPAMAFSTRAEISFTASCPAEPGWSPPAAPPCLRPPGCPVLSACDWRTLCSRVLPSPVLGPRSCIGRGRSKVWTSLRRLSRLDWGCVGVVRGLPIWMGVGLRGEARKAATRELDNTRYLPSLTEEIEYMTTKKANSSVMKSAYDTNHRSWFSCSSCFFLRAMIAGTPWTVPATAPARTGPGAH